LNWKKICFGDVFVYKQATFNYDFKKLNTDGLNIQGGLAE